MNDSTTPKAYAYKGNKVDIPAAAAQMLPSCLKASEVQWTDMSAASMSIRLVVCFGERHPVGKSEFAHWNNRFLNIDNTQYYIMHTSRMAVIVLGAAELARYYEEHWIWEERLHFDVAAKTMRITEDYYIMKMKGELNDLIKGITNASTPPTREEVVDLLRFSLTKEPADLLISHLEI